MLHKAIGGSNPFGQRGTLNDINLPFHDKDVTVTNWEDLENPLFFLLLQLCGVQQTHKIQLIPIDISEMRHHDQLISRGPQNQMMCKC